MGFLFEKETKQLIGLIYDVRNKMGGGWNEEMYHRGLVQSLQEHNIPVLSKPRSTLRHQEVDIYTFEADIIVWDKIILELKVLPKFRGRSFPSENMAQIIHYQKQFGIKLGYLVNFAHSKVGLQAVGYSLPETLIVEDYERIQGKVEGKDRQTLNTIRQHIMIIAKLYGAGFNEVVYRKLISAEFASNNIDCIVDVNIPAHFEGRKVGSQKSQMLLVAGNFLVLVRANIKYPPAYDFTKMKSFLSALGLTTGLIINFNRSEIQFHGVSL